MKRTYTEDERREPLRELLREALPDQDASTNEEVASLSGTQLRDRLIAHQPLDTDWIKRTNQVSTDCVLPLGPCLQGCRAPLVTALSVLVSV